MWDSGDPYNLMASYYHYNGLNASESDSPSLDTVISEVSSGHPYTLCNLLTSVCHVIVINGVGEKEGTVIANDPYGNANSNPWPNYHGKDVEYDWPGYNNGYQNLNGAAWGVSVRDTPISTPDSIVDDLQFNNGFILNNAPPASMSLWLDKANFGYAGHFWYTYTRRSDTCTAEWIQPASLQDGNYEVLAYIPSGTAKAAKYRILYKGDSATVVVDQSQYRDSWASLGVYPFGSGDSGYVKLGDGSDSVGQILDVDAMARRYQSPLLVRNSPHIPGEMTLEQNYPNPFNPATTIEFSIPRNEHVTLKIYDALGRTVRTLVDQELQPGNHEASLDGSLLSSGVYIGTLRAGGRVGSIKLLLLK